MNIPKSIKIMGQDVEVVIDKELAFETINRGETNYRRNQIKIQPKTDTWPMPEQQLENTLVHEIIHWIMHLLSEDNKIHNEQFVERFSNVLYQVLKDNDLNFK